MLKTNNSGNPIGCCSQGGVLATVADVAIASEKIPSLLVAGEGCPRLVQSSNMPLGPKSFQTDSFLPQRRKSEEYQTPQSPLHQLEKATYIPSDTKSLLAQRYSEVIIFEKLRISPVISRKRSFLPGDFEGTNPSKITKKKNQGPKARGCENPALRHIYHHHPESKRRKSSDLNPGSIHPYSRYGNAGKTSKTISTIAILWPVKAIFREEGRYGGCGYFSFSLENRAFGKPWFCLSDTRHFRHSRRFRDSRT